MADTPSANKSIPSAVAGVWSQLSKPIYTWLGVAFLLIVHFGLCADQARQSTPTVDEIAHLPAGMTYLEKRTFKLYPHNPPLARALAAFPSLWLPMPVLYAGTWQNHSPPDHWLFAFGCLEYANSLPNGPEKYLLAFTRGRLVIAAISTLSLLFIFLWSRQWFGVLSGWLALILSAFCPNLLTHASLVTTDSVSTSLTVIGSYYFACWIEQKSWLRALIAGTILGLAQLSKFSCLWLYGIWGLWYAISLVYPAKQMDNQGIASRFFHSVAQLTFMFILSVFIINAGYLFEEVGRPLSQFDFVSTSLTRPRTGSDPAPRSTSNRAFNSVLETRINRFVGTPLASLPVPLPRYYLAGFDMQKFEAESKYQMYLFGKFAKPYDSANPNARRGWISYYLTCLLLKLTEGHLVPILVAILSIFFFRREFATKTFPLLLLAVTPIAAMTLLTDINLGLRYVLASLPFLYILGSSAVATKRPGRFMIFGWSAGVALASLTLIHPMELSYFNTFAGGPKHGRDYLIDSNIDWGQDLRRLARFCDKHPEWKSAKLAYFGTVYPEMEGLADFTLAPRGPSIDNDQSRWPTESSVNEIGPLPGKYIVSVNYERGMFFHTPCPSVLFTTWFPQPQNRQLFLGPSRMLRVPKGAYSYFQQFKPTIFPEVGYSLLFYDLNITEVNKVRSAMKLPLLAPVKQPK